MRQQGHIFALRLRAVRISTHTLYPFPTHPHPPNKAPYPPIAHIKE
ncbi:hypothetical protein GIV52_05340 [Pseudomonas syringae]|uniref:Uncharacterized protein n=1 Tax=Pseudomonas syringae TaxID=317 RepID=A0A9Q4A5T8_PSESX|nr:hypothetical protein [Pseudomonas syringae]MCF5473212.1 hypothetical protein [Pseudomonas syringae]MCF5483227.1 hypothetical protein [Pseudomonas syringae]MCF5487179.1 hypothetical protein [Pseudomonas syringae]MCF5491240.1 hypothetical protein [Pseudomonas syringae]